MPAKTPAARTQQTPVSDRHGNRLQLPYSYGNITVRTMSRIPVSKSGARSVERDTSLGRHEQRFLEMCIRDRVRARVPSRR